MSKKIERKDRKFKFETLQLHVGQESRRSGYRCKSSTDLRRHLPMYSSNCEHAAARFRT